jgi:hypothetical protein
VKTISNLVSWRDYAFKAYAFFEMVFELDDNDVLHFTNRINPRPPTILVGIFPPPACQQHEQIFCLALPLSLYDDLPMGTSSVYSLLI